MFFFVIKCGVCRALRLTAINYPKNLVISDVRMRDRGTQIRVKQNTARKHNAKKGNRKVMKKLKCRVQCFRDKSKEINII